MVKIKCGAFFMACTPEVRMCPPWAWYQGVCDVSMSDSGDVRKCAPWEGGFCRMPRCKHLLDRSFDADVVFVILCWWGVFWNFTITFKFIIMGLVKSDRSSFCHYSVIDLWLLTAVCADHSLRRCSSLHFFPVHCNCQIGVLNSKSNCLLLRFKICWASHPFRVKATLASWQLHVVSLLISLLWFSSPPSPGRYSSLHTGAGHSPIFQGSWPPPFQSSGPLTKFSPHVWSPIPCAYVADGSWVLFSCLVIS